MKTVFMAEYLVPIQVEMKQIGMAICSLSLLFLPCFIFLNLWHLQSLNHIRKKVESIFWSYNCINSLFINYSCRVLLLYLILAVHRFIVKDNKLAHRFVIKHIKNLDDLKLSNPHKFLILYNVSELTKPFKLAKTAMSVYLSDLFLPALNLYCYFLLYYSKLGSFCLLSIITMQSHY